MRKSGKNISKLNAKDFSSTIKFIRQLKNLLFSSRKIFSQNLTGNMWRVRRERFQDSEWSQILTKNLKIREIIILEEK